MNETAERVYWTALAERAEELLDRLHRRRELWMLLDATEIGSASERDAYRRYQEARVQVVRTLKAGLHSGLPLV